MLVSRITSMAAAQDPALKSSSPGELELDARRSENRDHRHVTVKAPARSASWTQRCRTLAPRVSRIGTALFTAEIRMNPCQTFCCDTARTLLEISRGLRGWSWWPAGVPNTVEPATELALPGLSRSCRKQMGFRTRAERSHPNVGQANG